MTPRVSICLPTLNACGFLDERIATIVAQTLSDWELVAVDGFSTDGTWDRLKAWAAMDARVRLFQETPRGVYQAFNRCIEKALGRFIYIATADDTMTPDCLAKMVAALDAHPECGVAHCCLTITDSTGRAATGTKRWDEYDSVRFFGPLMDRPHVRYAPHDGLVALTMFTSYFSMTQILTRRQVFDRVGDFRTCWGSFGDTEWQMRVGLVTNTVHVPEYLATWRRHPAQASQEERFLHAEKTGWFCDMADSALRFLRSVNPVLAARLVRSGVANVYRHRYLRANMRDRSGVFRKTAYLARALLSWPMAALFCAMEGLACRVGVPPPRCVVPADIVRRTLRHLGHPTVVETQSAA